MDTHKYNFKQTNKMEFDLGDIGMLVYALNTLILIPRSDSKQKQKIYLFKKKHVVEQANRELFSLYRTIRNLDLAIKRMPVKTCW